MLATGNKTLSSYRLSIRFGADGFSFSVLNTLDGSEVQSDRFPVPQADLTTEVLRQALRKPYLMDYRFQSVEVVTDSPSTILPLEYFNKSEMLPFYRLCFPGRQAHVMDMQYQILPSLEAVMIFSFSQDLLRVVQECYPEVKVCSAEAQQLEEIADVQGKQPAPDDVEQRDVYARFDEKQFFVAAFYRSKLLYAATQTAANDDDRAFLLLGIWKALELNAQRDMLHLQGVSKGLYNVLREYILNVD